MPQESFLGHNFLKKGAIEKGFFRDFFSRIDFLRVHLFCPLALKILGFLTFLPL